MDSNNTNKSNHNTNNLNQDASPNKDNFILDELKNEINLEDTDIVNDSSQRFNTYDTNEPKKPIRFDGLTGKPIYEDSSEDNWINNETIPKKNSNSTKIIIATSLVVLLGGGFAIGNSLVTNKKSPNENSSSASNENINANNSTNNNSTNDTPESKTDDISTEEEEKVEPVEEPSIEKENGNTNTSDLYNNLDKSKTKNNFIFNSTTSKVTYSDLKNLSSDELEIAKSEVLARHGATFLNDKPNLQKYFNSQKWYKPNPKFSMNSLSQVEKDNYELIRADQFVKDAYNASGPLYGDFVFPNSNTELLSSYEVSRLSDWQIVIARNEIYARYGLRFSIDCLASHFTSRSWYTPVPGLSNSMPLNSIESKNISLILKEEESRENGYQRDISSNY